MPLARAIQPPPEKTTPPASKPQAPKKAAPKPPLQASLPPAIPLELQLSWSRAARSHLPDPKMAPRLKKVIQMALQTTLQMAPPRFPALQDKLQTKDSPAFALDFSMVDDAKIEALNRQYRGKNRPTDVLSFALWEETFDADESDEAELDALHQEDADDFVFPDFGDEIALGDLVISTQTAARQAAEQNHSFEREIAFLTIHGALHLLGYDHDHDSARRGMFARQDAIFEAVFADAKK